MEKIRLLVAEDETIIRMALVKLLMSYPGYFIVGEAGNGNELIKKFPALNPDIVLCDITMPEMNGMESSVRILRQNSAAKIILFTMHCDEEYLYSALKIGVSGFVTKSLSENDLKSAIQTVYKGGTYYLGKTDEEIEELKSRCGNIKKESKFEQLTTREKEILCLVAGGLTSEEMSRKLFVSKRTIDNHRYAIREKLGISKRSEIVDLIKNIKQQQVLN